VPSMGRSRAAKREKRKDKVAVRFRSASLFFQDG